MRKTLYLLKHFVFVDVAVAVYYIMISSFPKVVAHALRDYCQRL